VFSPRQLLRRGKRHSRTYNFFIFLFFASRSTNRPRPFGHWMSTGCGVGLPTMLLFSSAIFCLRQEANAIHGLKPLLFSVPMRFKMYRRIIGNSRLISGNCYLLAFCISQNELVAIASGGTTMNSLTSILGRIVT